MNCIINDKNNKYDNNNKNKYQQHHRQQKQQQQSHQLQPTITNNHTPFFILPWESSCPLSEEFPHRRETKSEMQILTNTTSEEIHLRRERERVREIKM